jgi:hypothetical protein
VCCPASSRNKCRGRQFAEMPCLQAAATPKLPQTYGMNLRDATLGISRTVQAVGASAETGIKGQGQFLSHPARHFGLLRIGHAGNFFSRVCQFYHLTTSSREIESYGRTTTN